MISSYDSDKMDGHFEIPFEKLVDEISTCMDDIMAVFEQEKLCIKRHDLIELGNLALAKKRCTERYESLFIILTDHLISQTLSQADVDLLKKKSDKFIKKSTENYFYLGCADELNKDIIATFVDTHHHIDKQFYSSSGEHVLSYQTRMPLTLYERV